jgi:hypothetical protein
LQINTRLPVQASRYAEILTTDMFFRIKMSITTTDKKVSYKLKIPLKPIMAVCFTITFAQKQKIQTDKYYAYP